jgi:hypothetical protein
MVGQHRQCRSNYPRVLIILLDIPIDALTQLREESTESIRFTVGEIYRTLRLYQLAQNAAQEQKWWARLGSEDRRKQIRRLQRDAYRRGILDKLLPYAGLWKPLRSSQITRMLGLKCPEASSIPPDILSVS